MEIVATLFEAEKIKGAAAFARLADGRVAIYFPSDLSTPVQAVEIPEAAPMFQYSDPGHCGPLMMAGAQYGHRVLRADRTGSKNATAAIKTFIESCIADKCDGYIPPGNYKITPGELVFTCGASHTPLPFIYTDGAYKTTFIADPASPIDAPFVSFVTSTANRFWQGGGLDGITFHDPYNAAYSSRHGVVLSGCWCPTFEHLRCTALNGDLLSIPQKGVGTDPDPYVVGFLKVPLIEGGSCRRVINNNNGVGLSNYKIGFLRATSTKDGIFRGLGTSGVIEGISAGNCRGWALEDTGNEFGGMSKLSVLSAELDNCEYGIQIRNCVGVRLDSIRFIHRFKFADNTNSEYWPRQALSIAGGAVDDVRDADIFLWHRIESGGAIETLGNFVTANSSPNIKCVNISCRLVDNSGLAVSADRIYKNFHAGVVATYCDVNGVRKISRDNNI